MIKLFKNLFYIGCFVAAMYFFGSCIQEYVLNEDTSTVRFKSFHSDENSLYPSLTLCFGDFWNFDFNLKKDYDDPDPEFDYDTGVEFRDAFKQYLSGCEGYSECTWNKSFENIDYDNVSINLMDYVTAEITVFEDDTTFKYAYPPVLKSESVWNETSQEMIFSDYKGGTRVYTSKRTSDSKCITFDIPFRKGKLVRHHSILLDNTIFQGSGKNRPNDLFQAFFHLPHQTMRKTSKKSTWTDTDKLMDIGNCDDIFDYDLQTQCRQILPSTYTMVFDVHHILSVSRRNKPKDHCSKNWRHDDIVVLTELAAKVGCKPKHWNTTSNYPVCQEMRSMNYLHKAVEKVIPVESCYSIERYSYHFVEKTGLDVFNTKKNQEFLDTFRFDWKFREILEIDTVVSEVKILFDGMT